LARQKKFESISSFRWLGKHAESSFQKRVYGGLDREEWVEELREFNVAQAASTDERQGVNSWPDKNGMETSIA